MADSRASALASLPSVDRLLRRPEADALVAEYGRQAVTDAVRAVLQDLRQAPALASQAAAQDAVLSRALQRLEAEARPSLRPVFNLTGTVLHTNLGRAPLPAEAIDAIRDVAREASNLEYDLARGRRGERDAHQAREADSFARQAAPDRNASGASQSLDSAVATPHPGQSDTQALQPRPIWRPYR